MRFSRGLKSTERGRMGLAGGYALSALITAFIIWMIIAAPGSGPLGPSSPVLFGLVCANLALLLTLSFFVLRRVFHLARTRGADAGARLHVRFVTMFALAAVTPAFVVALFFGVLVNRGVETWFSDRVQSSVENGAFIAKTFLDSQVNTASDTLTDVARDLQRPYMVQLFANRLSFGVAMRDLISIRGELTAVYLIDDSGQVLARAENPGAPPYLTPSQNAIDTAAEGDIGGGVFSTPDAVRLIYPLQGYGGAKLYGVKVLPDGIMDKVSSAQSAIVDLRETSENSARVQGVFALAYMETVLLVLIGAIWVGTSAADSIAVPVARLVQAADKVASGDLNARVMTDKQSQDIAVLSRAFNRMTSDLQTQQAALKSANQEAEERRRFIETVLSEISAGIVGLDEFENISAINRHAANFLSEAVDAALGRHIRDLAPEISELLDKVTPYKVEEAEVDLVRKGETRRVRVRASSLDTGGAVLTFDDITRLVAAQRNAAWKDVARRIAHEIKNPLTPIQLSAERLKRKYRVQIETDGETFDRLTDTIVRQVGDIGRMVDEFSAFARMPVPNFAEEDAAELVRHAVFAQRVAKPDVQIDIAEPLPEVSVVCDGRMLAQALGNVLKNGGEAIVSRHMAAGEGGEGGQMRVEMRQEEGFLTIEIEDDGIGLPDKDRDRLTEPYVTTREKGTGLGLAIVKRILEDHGGEFYLADAVHLSGARAILRLPKTQTQPVTSEAPDNGTRMMRV
ncbi:PAS domain-containing sensor histidine kinase [Asticcacaulis sp. BYS171W]|uniref:histidine kinase n=1 Tax=Asticcacaulis aquaticus TaxID=2984212 RepID=A0ABT5HPQ5_9CAUL|nr:PAS domain-containing sensor histidine kinase [Asticcacaulis aquaticus]MDC7681800.1 PAS domain-containing sensor histidine kinase [Asticcacaulis aquaticus]